MHFAAVISTLAVAASAAPFQTLMRIKAIDSYQWNVTEWKAGCENSTCTYDFKVAGEGTPDSKPPRPAFEARCGGAGVGSPYRLCTLLDEADKPRRVAAKLLPSNSTTTAQIQVSLQYTDLEVDTTWWNYTGHADTPYHRLPSQGADFKVKPSEIFGVA